MIGILLKKKGYSKIGVNIVKIFLALNTKQIIAKEGNN